MLKSIGFEEHKELEEFVNKYVDRKDVVAIVYGGFFQGFGLFYYSTEESDKGLLELKKKEKKENKESIFDIVLVLILTGVIAFVVIFLLEKFL